MRVYLLISSLLLGAVLALPSVPVVAQQKKEHGHSDHKHSHPTPQHGGVLEDVGEYHVELLVEGGKIILHVRDHDAQEAQTEGMKASVLFTSGSQRVGPVEVKPAGGSKMEASVAAVPAGATAILTLTDKDGTAAQGRFRLK